MVAYFPVTEKVLWGSNPPLSAKKHDIKIKVDITI